MSRLMLIEIFEKWLVSAVSEAWIATDGLDRGDIAKEERSHHCGSFIFFDIQLSSVKSDSEVP